MSDVIQELAQQIEQRFSALGGKLSVSHDEIGLEIPRDKLLEVCTALRDEAPFAFEQLMDVCGVDYLDYGQGQWQGPRFAAVYHLLSISKNQRLRIKTFLDDDFPVVDSVIEIWASASWFEREAFDLYGIIFEGHPDLRRILTDYGFVGHPFRKDFPLSGNVEMRYDEEKKRVIYEPVSIEPRITVPRIIREDHRYVDLEQEGGA